MDSYGKFMELAMKPKETGAYLRQSVFYFKDMVQDLPAQLDKMNELCHLPGFRHDGKLIEETGKSSYDTLSNVRSFYEYFCLMLIRVSPNKSAFISYLLTDFNASYICMLCCASPLCSHTDFWLKGPWHAGYWLKGFFSTKGSSVEWCMFQIVYSFVYRVVPKYSDRIYNSLAVILCI